MNRFKIIINLYLVIITNILRKIPIFSSKTRLVRRVAFRISCQSPEGPALQKAGFLVCFCAQSARKEGKARRRRWVGSWGGGLAVAGVSLGAGVWGCPAPPPHVLP